MDSLERFPGIDLDQFFSLFFLGKSTHKSHFQEFSMIFQR